MFTRSALNLLAVSRVGARVGAARGRTAALRAFASNSAKPKFDETMDAESAVGATIASVAAAAEPTEAARRKAVRSDDPARYTPDVPTHPQITVIGVGGAGGNTINNMIARHVDGVDFLVANTDGQALSHSLATRRVQLGRQVTKGLGAGARPAVGAEAAVESLDSVMSEVSDSHMVFVTAGMGGGTGTGAAPVIAKACRELGILTVGIVTKPFDFEGRARMRQAAAGISELEAVVDTLIVIPNQKLLAFDDGQGIGFADAFKMVDNVLYEGVKGVTDLIVMPGLINLDFADVKAIMQNMGRALMGTGEAEGEHRARMAAEMALHNPLLEDVSVEGATGVLISIQGGNDLTLTYLLTYLPTYLLR